MVCPALMLYLCWFAVMAEYGREDGATLRLSGGLGMGILTAAGTGSLGACPIAPAYSPLLAIVKKVECIDGSS